MSINTQDVLDGMAFDSNFPLRIEFPRIPYAMKIFTLTSIAALFALALPILAQDDPTTTDTDVGDTSTPVPSDTTTDSDTTDSTDFPASPTE